MKFIRTFSLFCLCFLLSSLFINLSFAETRSFSDLDNSHPRFTAMEVIAELGIISGDDGQGTTRPDDPINRAELMKVLLFDQDPDPNVYKDCFPDVGTEWFAPYVCFGLEQGYIDGFPDGNFYPAENASVVEGMKMIVNTQDWNDELSNDQYLRYLDTDSDQWYAPYVELGDRTDFWDAPGPYLDPASELTRGMTAEALFRLKAMDHGNVKNYDDDAKADFLQDLDLWDLLDTQLLVVVDEYEKEGNQLNASDYSFDDDGVFSLDSFSNELQLWVADDYEVDDSGSIVVVDYEVDEDGVVTLGEYDQGFENWVIVFIADMNNDLVSYADALERENGELGFEVDTDEADESEESAPDDTNDSYEDSDYDDSGYPMQWDSSADTSYISADSPVYDEYCGPWLNDENSEYTCSVQNMFGWYQYRFTDRTEDNGGDSTTITRYEHVNSVFTYKIYHVTAIFQEGTPLYEGMDEHHQFYLLEANAQGEYSYEYDRYEDNSAFGSGFEDTQYQEWIGPVQDQVSTSYWNEPLQIFPYYTNERVFSLSGSYVDVELKVEDWHIIGSDGEHQVRETYPNPFPFKAFEMEADGIQASFSGSEVFKDEVTVSAFDATYYDYGEMSWNFSSFGFGLDTEPDFASSEMEGALSDDDWIDWFNSVKE